MKIKNITYVDTNETRTDGKYPMRIGCEVEFLWEPVLDEIMYLDYVADNEGNPKYGTLTTSRVKNIVETDDEFVVETKNSVYYLEKEE